MKILSVQFFIIFANSFTLRSPLLKENDKASPERTIEKIEDVSREKQLQLILFNVDDIIDINNNEIKISFN